MIALQRTIISVLGLGKVSDIDFRKERPIGDVLMLAFEFLRQHFGPLFKAIGVIAGPVIAAASLLVAIVGYSIYSEGEHEGGASQVISTAYTMNALSMVVFALVNVVMSVVVYSYLKLYLAAPKPRTFEVKEVWQGARPYLGKAIALWLACLCLLGVAALLLLLPALYLYPGLAGFAVWVMMYEKRPLMGAIWRSIDIANIDWWGTVALTILVAIIRTMLGYLFSVPFYLYLIVASLTSLQEAENSGLLSIGLYTLSIVGSYLLEVITCMANVAQYHHLLESQEHPGLVARVAHIGQPVEEVEEEDY